MRPLWMERDQSACAGGKRARSVVACAALSAAVVATLAGAASRASASVTGFGGAGMTGWTANGTNNGNAANNSSPPTVTGTGTAADMLNITDSVNGLSRSYFFNTPQPLTNGGWTASFTYNFSGATSATPADGVAFVIQNDPRGATAVGSGGGQLGFGGAAAVGPGVVKSQAVEWSVFGNNTGFFQNAGAGNGFISTINPSANVTGAGTNFRTVNNPYNFTLTYNGANQITETITDTVTPGNSFTRSYPVPNTARQLGTNEFLVGFTGGTGGFNAAEQISNFSFTTSGAQVAAPTIVPILKATDTVTAVHLNAASGQADPATGTAEGPDKALDGNASTKYLNQNGTRPGGVGNSGIVVTPGVGNSIVTALSLTSANDTPTRDPASYEVWGSNDGTNFNLISAGTMAAFDNRQNIQDFDFANTTQYSTYRVNFPTQGSSTLFQIADIQLYGVVVPEPTSFAALGAAGVLMLARRRREA